MEKYIENPVSMKDLLYKKVDVSLVKSNNKSGWIHSIDPITGSLVLLDFGEQNQESCEHIHLIPGPSITSVEVKDDILPDSQKSVMNSFLRKPEVNLSEDQVEARRENLLRWFGMNRVPIELCDDMSLNVLNVATIRPPYESSYSIECGNEIILDKVMKLMQSAPEIK